MFKIYLFCAPFVMTAIGLIWLLISMRTPSQYHPKMSHYAGKAVKGGLKGIIKGLFD
jgi:surface polysaccharide O-acyltransferase-like enzyme